MAKEKSQKGDEINTGSFYQDTNNLLLEGNNSDPVSEVSQGKSKTIFNTGALVTKGVGPCIAIILHGKIHYLDENADDQSATFISLYHFEDTFYPLHSVGFDHEPNLEELNKEYKKYIPMLITHQNHCWVYGFSANKEPLLTPFIPQSKRDYQKISFPTTPTIQSASEPIYKEIGKAKAHCHYFDLTGKKSIEQEDNFNYCLEITQQNLIEKLFSNIESTLDKEKEDVQLIKIQVNQIVLIGGQKTGASPELSGTEMRAMAFKNIFENPKALANAIQEDMNIVVDFSQSKLNSDNLLKTQDEDYFDLAAFFSKTEGKFLVNCLEISQPKSLFIPKNPSGSHKTQRHSSENTENSENHAKKRRVGSGSKQDLQKHALLPIQPLQALAYLPPVFHHAQSNIKPHMKENIIPKEAFKNIM